MKPQRRRFLQSAATLTAGMAAVPCDPDLEAAQAAPAAPFRVSGDIQPPGAELLPTLTLGRHRLTRLIVGSNPFHGFSHFNRLLNNHMSEWATTERVTGIVERCQQHGINTWQFSHHPRAMKDLAAHRAGGGRMQWILLSHREVEEDPKLLEGVAQLEPVGVVHHGGSAERKRREGQLHRVRDFLKAVRDSGVRVGLSMHDPKLLEQVESEGWDIDFYMTSLYYLTRSPDEFRKLLGTRPLGEIYLPEDPPRMFAAIRATKKTCLCYKVLAAGRLTDSNEQIERAFRMVFDNVKPQDGMIVGMYPRYADQVRENADRVRRILAVKTPA